ncbi:glycosyltransferase family 9 protein [Pantanalinema rosaneae CENA516]|uniref:glycosyltransferase family 9 protein n=1 Tax=Pantanalinema rosaneae TaxID=1620701 RepID=UPI003D6F598E
MPPEPWQEVARLLILCSSDDQNQLAALNVALQVVKHNLPQAEITLLLLETSTYRYAPMTTTLDEWVQQTHSNYGDRGRTLIEQLQAHRYDAAMIFTTPGQSPYSLAYSCYLAGIPIRLGQSQEFGGGVLSPSVPPPMIAMTLTDYYLHLLTSVGFSVPEASALAIAE